MTTTIEPHHDGYEWTVTINGHVDTGLAPTETAAMRAAAVAAQHLEHAPIADTERKPKGKR